MTTFKEIRGTAVESVSSDPTNPEEGQIWYNNTIGVLKGYKSIGAVWSSGSALLTAKARYTQGGAGIQTAALAIGGWISSSTTQTEE